MDNFDYLRDKACSLWEFVVNAFSENPAGTLANKALLSFSSSVNRHGMERLGDDGLRIWIADMILAGLKLATRKRYFNSIHSLCRARYDFSQSDPFENVREDLNRNFDVRLEEADSNLKIVGNILKESAGAGKYECYDIFLCLLYDVNASLQDIINFSFDEAPGKLPQIEDIAETKKKSGRTKYVFGLRQSQARNTQIGRELITELSYMLRENGMKFNGSFSRDSIKEIWIAAALECGIKTEEIRSVVDVMPNGFAFLELVEPLELTNTERAKIIKKVADHINDNTKYWFVMRLRAGKTPDDVKDLLKAEDEALYNEIRFYNPTHIVIKEGSGLKKNHEEIPYLPGILFFYIRRDEVAMLFNRYIGSLAWCYRYANTPDSPYSAISRREMERFQRHVGKFTDDIRMEMVTREQPLAVDDVVMVYGGVMDGSVCTITGVKNKNGTRTYSLQLTDRTSFRWTVNDVEDIRLELLPKARNEALAKHIANPSLNRYDRAHT